MRKSRRRSTIAVGSVPRWSPEAAAPARGPSMSVDFTFALAGQSAGSDAIRQQLERELKELGYRRSPDEIPVGFDRTRGVFDEVEGGIGDEPACGWAVEYDKDGCTLYLLVALHRDGYVNAFVDVSGRTLERLVQEGALSILLAAVG